MERDALLAAFDFDFDFNLDFAFVSNSPFIECSVSTYSDCLQQS